MTSYDDVLTAVFRLEQHEEVTRLLHLSALLSRDHAHVVCRDVPRRADDHVVPGRACVLRTVRVDRSRHVLAELDDALLLVESTPWHTGIVVSGDSEPAAVALADELEARVPGAADRSTGVPVGFCDLETGVRHLDLDLRSWADARPSYAPDVQEALDALVAHVPEVDTGRRLLLWHGAPGTGKTSAVRALVHAWQGWAQPVVVTDPEALLTDGRYLRRLLLDVDEAGDDRWQLLVLEDAEALLRKDTGGPAMGRLLNLTDGLLGQGLRCLFLVTTNEPLAAVHPAVLRPGRCLAQVEFGALPAAQASALLGRPVLAPMTLAEVLGARPVETTTGAPAAVGQYL